MKSNFWLIFVGLAVFRPTFAHADGAPPFPDQILCETTTSPDDLVHTPKCARDVDPEFRAVLLAAYEMLPRMMQIEFVRFQKVYVRHNVPMGNAASVERVLTRDGSPLFSLNLNLKLKSIGGMGDYDTNKLLRRFGENHPTFSATQFDGVNLSIRYRSDGLDDRVFRLKYVLIHEIGHAVEGRYLRPRTQYNCRMNQDNTGECSLKPNSFPAISWNVVYKMGKTAKDDSQEIRIREPMRFVYLNMFCFFYCEGAPAFLRTDDVERIFSEFRILPFSSLYSLANHVEDFAETWTDFWLEKADGLHQQIIYNGEVVSDSGLKRDLPDYRRKLLFVQKLVRKIERLQNQPAKVNAGLNAPSR